MQSSLHSQWVADLFSAITVAESCQEIIQGFHWRIFVWAITARNDGVIIRLHKERQRLPRACVTHRREENSMDLKKVCGTMNIRLLTYCLVCIMQDYYWFYFELFILTADTNTSLVHLCIRSAMFISTVPGMLGAEIYSSLRLKT